MLELNIVYIITVISVIVVSMTLHEAMHAFAGYWQGDTTAKDEGRLTLNPIRHIDPFMTVILPLMLALVGAPIFGGAKPVPFNPSNLKRGEWSVALVALMGPLTNLLIAFVLFGIISVFKISMLSFVGEVMYIGVMVNLGFFVFNMLPIPPLDGSRVLYVLAPEFVRRGMEIIEQYGVMMVFVIVMIASYSGVLSVLIGNSINTILSLFKLVFVG